MTGANSIEKVSITRRLVTGSAWATLGKMLAAVSGLLLNALLARLLAPEELGAYFLIVSISLFGMLLAGLGIPKSIVRMIAGGLATGKDAAVRQSMRSAWLLTICGIALVSGIYAVAGGQWAGRIFNSTALQATALLAALLIAARTLQNLLSQMYRGFHDIRAAVLLEGCVSNLFMIAGLGVIWMLNGRAGLNTVLQIYVVAMTAVIITAGVMLDRRTRALPPAPRGGTGQVLQASVPLLVSGIALFSVNEAHIWILGAFRPEEEVAVFGVASRTARFIALPLLVINSVIPPMIAQLYAEQRFRKVEQVLRATATLAGMPSIVIMLVLWLVAGDLLGLLFGDYYARGAEVFVILLAAQTVNVLSGSPGVLLTMAEKQSVLMKFSVYSGVAGGLTSLVLVEGYGATGVAAGMACSMMLHNIGMWLYCRSVMGISTHLSVTAIPELWQRARRVISDRSQNGRPFWHRLEWAVCACENLWWSLRGKQVIECLGDSHTHIFRTVNAMALCPGLRFRITAVRGATAFGLGNPNSRTNAYRIFEDRLAGMGRNPVVLAMLGEVDTGFLIWLRAQQSGRPPGEVMEEALKRYFAFLDKKRPRIGRLIIASAPLPTIPDGSQAGEVARVRSEVQASQYERTRLTLRYNAGLRSWAERHGAYYLDLDTPALDAQSGLVKAELIGKIRTDHHYDPEVFARLICSSLDADSFRDWLSGH